VLIRFSRLRCREWTLSPSEPEVFDQHACTVLFCVIEHGHLRGVQRLGSIRYRNNVIVDLVHGLSFEDHSALVWGPISKASSIAAMTRFSSDETNPSPRGPPETLAIARTRLRTSVFIVLRPLSVNLDSMART
jgi:hypothetical protein